MNTENREQNEKLLFENGPPFTVPFDKEIFLAEYSSLRTEIHQRINQQTTVTQIAITALGVIITLALQISKPNGADEHKSSNDTLLLFAYPLLAFFLSFAWAFNNKRICQIGGYLRSREKQVSEHWGILYWENHVYEASKKRKIFSKVLSEKIIHGIATFNGTQIVAMVLILLDIILHHKTGLMNKLNMTIFLSELPLIILTFLNIYKSEH